MKNQKLLNKLIIALLIALLNACAVYYVPTTGQGVSVHSGHSLIIVDSLAVQIDPQLNNWPYKPDELGDYFTIVEISIKNTSRTHQYLHYEDVQLLDKRQQQYDAVSTKNLIDRYYSGRLKKNKFNKTNSELHSKAEIIANLYKKSFKFGKILPGAHKRGYVFFEKLPFSSPSISLVIKGKTVEFKRIEKQLF